MQKIRIRHPLGWTDKPSVCLSISCGMAYHEGDAFQAAMDSARTSGKQILVDLSDTLQRHNFIAQGCLPERAMEITRRIGDEWLERNAEQLKNATVLRWDRWLTHPDFKSIHSQLVQLDRTCELFSSTITDDIERFVKRQANQTALTRQCSRDFILEEAAGEILLAREFSCSRLYPGKELDTLRILRTLLVPNSPKGLERSSYYRFTIETQYDQNSANKAQLHPANSPLITNIPLQKTYGLH